MKVTKNTFLTIHFSFRIEKKKRLSRASCVTCSYCCHIIDIVLIASIVKSFTAFRCWIGEESWNYFFH